MDVPTHPIGLMGKVYKEVIPAVHQHLAAWRERAEKIPNPELRKQALASIDSKTFHCEGGAIMAILSRENMGECIQFIVAYQTISDYLDNLCDRSTSLDPEDFRALHDSMPHALILEGELENYYRLREDQDDGGYLHALVEACRSVLRKARHYEKISGHLLELAGFYCDLQVHKHVKKEERIPRLEKWFHLYKRDLPEMEWYEFSACSGSTLGIFCLVAYAFQENFNEEMAYQIRKSYFPYIQGLHILLDYLIDQEEDIRGGDLNFCSYYSDREEMMDRFSHFIVQADKHTAGIPHEKFHRLINRGLLGIYLSDEKVGRQRDVRRLARQLVRHGGLIAMFFYMNGRAYRKMQRFKQVLERRNGFEMAKEV